VIKHFVKYTLSQAMSLHFSQLKDYWKDMTTYPALQKILSGMLANTYEERPQDVRDALANWYKECINDVISGSQRDALLETVIKTYGQIRFEPDGLIKFSEVIKRANYLLKRNETARVRNAAIQAIGYLAEHHLEAVESDLEALMNDMSVRDRQDITRILSNIYMYQRRKQNGGDIAVKLGRVTYSAWYTQRPPTKVEAMVSKWFKNGVSREAMATALDISIANAINLDQPEQNELRRLEQELIESKMFLEERRREEVQQASGDVPVPERETKESAGWWENLIVPWLATLGADAYRQRISHLLPVMRKYQLEQPEALYFVLDGWVNSSDLDLAALGSLTYKALGIAERWRPWFLGGISGLVIILIILCVMFIS
jgi:hypothetical protein